MIKLQASRQLHRPSALLRRRYIHFRMPAWKITVYKSSHLPKVSIFPSYMKAISLLLLLLSLAFLLGGCASNSEDRAFFETGWRHPGDNESRMER